MSSEPRKTFSRIIAPHKRTVLLVEWLFFKKLYKNAPSYVLFFYGIKMKGMAEVCLEKGGFQTNKLSFMLFYRTKGCNKTVKITRGWIYL